MILASFSSLTLDDPLLWGTAVALCGAILCGIAYAHQTKKFTKCLEAFRGAEGTDGYDAMKQCDGLRGFCRRAGIALSIISVLLFVGVLIK